MRANIVFAQGIIFIVFLFCGATARATIDNRNVFPFGEREAFLGNTGAAGAASSAAVFYNPAALIQLDHAQIAVSGSTYLSLKTQTDKFARIDNTDLGYQESGFSTIPATVISTFKPSDDLAYAYFILVPEAFSLSNRQTLPTPNTRTTLIQVQSAQDLWIGASAALRLDSRWTVGLSLYGMQHKELTSLSVIAEIPSVANSIVFSDEHLQSSMTGLSTALGVLYQPGGDWQFGAKLQTPPVRLSGSANGYRTTQSVASGTLTGSENEDPDIAARYLLPTDLSVGARWSIASWLSLLADLGFQFGADYDPYPSSTFSTRLHADPSFRLNTGAEFGLTQRISLGTGFVVNPSTVHNLNTSSEGDARQDFVGGTLGAFYRSDRIKTGVGGFYLSGNGDIVTISGGGTTAPLKRQAFGALLSVSYYL